MLIISDNPKISDYPLLAKMTTVKLCLATNFCHTINNICYKRDDQDTLVIIPFHALQGALAFYKGFLPNFGRLGSWNVIMFLTLEQVRFR